MNNTPVRRKIPEVVLSGEDSEVRDIIVEEEADGMKKPAEHLRGVPRSGDDIEWGDLSRFGPVLPPGTDVLKNKPFYRFFKRFFDIVLCSLALIVLMPFLLIIALIVFIDDPHGSPIFIQWREGKNRRKFKILKFRSMVVNAEELLESLRKQGKTIKSPNDPTYKLKDDPRMTRFGKFIRKTSIDELPQLINVIKGDMSIVGPRPPIPREVDVYNDFALQRLLVRPGLTCIWQTTRNRDDVPFPDWMKMDVTYIQHCSFLLDCKLIFKTFAIVFSANGH